MYRILIADDSWLQRQLISNILKNKGKFQTSPYLLKDFSRKRELHFIQVGRP